MPSGGDVGNVAGSGPIGQSIEAKDELFWCEMAELEGDLATLAIGYNYDSIGASGWAKCSVCRYSITISRTDTNKQKLLIDLLELLKLTARSQACEHIFDLARSNKDYIEASLKEFRGMNAETKARTLRLWEMTKEEITQNAKIHLQRKAKPAKQQNSHMAKGEGIQNGLAKRPGKTYAYRKRASRSDGGIQGSKA